MSETWISAKQAYDLLEPEVGRFQAHFPICRRAHAGLLQARARLLKIGEQEQHDVPIPAAFWWAQGHEALDQDWDTGDFSTWIDQRVHWQAFEVSFQREQLLSMISPHRRAELVIATSVTTDPKWIAARHARLLVSSAGGMNIMNAGPAIINCCELGHIVAKALRFSASHTRLRGEPVFTDAIECDVPVWFWKTCQMEGQSSQNWDLGKFSGKGRSAGVTIEATVWGTHFLRSSLQVLIPADAINQLQIAPMIDEQLDPTPVELPPLSEKALNDWWKKRASMRDVLPQDDLLKLVRADHPNNSISRDRIRALATGRRPGRKPIGG